MLSHFEPEHGAPKGEVRRDFLKKLAMASAAAWMAAEPKQLFALPDGARVLNPQAKADSIIVLWMGGGMGAPDTFDPKHYEPFEVGKEVASVLSTFPSIRTNVDNIEISQGLEQIAQVMDRATLVRSHIQPDLGSINPVIPPFINIGQRLEGVGEQEELKAFTTAGFFGSEYGPMNLPYPEEAAVSVRPPKGMELSRFQNRHKFFKKLVDSNPQRDQMSDFQRDSMIRSIDGAYRLLESKERDAFDISLEPKESYEKYDTGRFGRGCLLARRLVEAGARYVEVTTEYVPFLHWDTHADGHTTLERMKKEIDQPIAQLILDLEASGLLDRTLVILASEFSRDMLMEGQPGSDAADQAEKVDRLTEMKHYGLHRHFTGGSSIVMWGGGVKKGFLYGKTAPERPCIAIENPLNVTDLHATLMHAMGISPKTVFEIEQRPFYVTEDGKGLPRLELFA